MSWRKRVNYRPARHDEIRCLECMVYEVHGDGELGICFSRFTGLKKPPTVRDVYTCDHVHTEPAKPADLLSSNATISEPGPSALASPDAGRVPLPASECADVAHEGASGGSGAEPPCCCDPTARRPRPADLARAVAFDRRGTKPPIPAFENSEAEFYFGVGNGCEPCASYRGTRARPDLECGFRHERRAGEACADFQRLR